METDRLKENIKWNDSRDEIWNIVLMIKRNEAVQVPLKCPICGTDNAHIHMHRWENARGTIWAWCSNCKSCTHASSLELPDWWQNNQFIDVSELTSHPVYLDAKVSLIDEHLRQLLEKEH